MSLLGYIHTIIGVIAVIAGLIALFKDFRITSRNALGKVYLHTTIWTCLTGFGIFHQGGFGAPHILGIVTLVVLGIATLAEYKKSFGSKSLVVEVVAYTLTLFFHFIPGITETSTRLPVGAPLIASRESPVLQGIIGGTFVVFLIIMIVQARYYGKQARSL